MIIIPIINPTFSHKPMLDPRDHWDLQFHRTSREKPSSSPAATSAARLTSPIYATKVKCDMKRDFNHMILIRYSYDIDMILYDIIHDIHGCVWKCWLNPEKPNGFADHYPVFKWLAIIGNIPHFQTDPHGSAKHDTVTRGQKSFVQLSLWHLWILSTGIQQCNIARRLKVPV